MHVFLDAHPVISHALGKLDKWGIKSTTILYTTKAYTCRSVLDRCYPTIQRIQVKYVDKFWSIVGEIVIKYREMEMNDKTLKHIVQSIPKSPVGKALRQYISNNIGVQPDFDAFLDKLQDVILPAESELAQIDFTALEAILKAELTIVEDGELPIYQEVQDIQSEFPNNIHQTLLNTAHHIAIEEGHENLSLVTLERTLLDQKDLIVDKTAICDVADVGTFYKDFCQP